MWQVIGQNKAVALLQRSLETGSLAHAYLFVGPAHVGKMLLAMNLAQALNCEAAEPPCGECISCQKIAEAKHADVQIIGLSSDNDSAESKSRMEISIDNGAVCPQANVIPNLYPVLGADGCAAHIHVVPDDDRGVRAPGCQNGGVVHAQRIRREPVAHVQLIADGYRAAPVALDQGQAKDPPALAPPDSMQDKVKPYDWQPGPAPGFVHDLPGRIPPPTS